MKASHIALISGLLLGMMVAVSAVMHQSMVEACVCVVNSAARATVSLAITTLLGALLGIEPLASGRVTRIMNLVQVVSFAAALFFLIQHVFFVLQLA
jgi:hypothetical protein